MDIIEWRGEQEELFRESLRRIISREGSRRVAVLYVRLSGIRRLRLIHGRRFCEHALRMLHERLESVIRPGDRMDVLGPGELLLCLANLKNAGHARLAVIKILREAGAEQEVDGCTFRLKARVGGSLYPDAGREPDGLIEAALSAVAVNGASDEAWLLKDAEEATREPYFDIETAVREGLGRDQFSLYYQPQFDLKTKAIVGAEALIRWHHPEKGLIPPGNFIPTVERTDLVHEVTHWCLHRALHDRDEWMRAGFDIPVSVNMAGRSFENPSLRESVTNAASLWGLPEKRLVLEVTEGTVLANLEHVSAELAAFRANQIKIAIDDFGTGYSSLAYLSRLPIDELKIDQSFVRNLGTSEADQRLVSVMVKMAQAFDMDVVAEGIEDDAALQLLGGFGCQVGQGYLFSRPLPRGDFVSLLRANGVSSHGAGG